MQPSKNKCGHVTYSFFLLLTIAFTLLGQPAHALPPLQLFVDITPEGGVLSPPAGDYAGPVVIDKPMTLDGKSKVTLDGEGKGTVLTVKADHVIVRGMHITHSGDSHDKVDAGILVEADGALLEDNTIDNSLFGIHLKAANDNIVRNNRMASFLDREDTLRGDGIRLWYSSDNLIENNDITNVRDLVFANSPDNRISNNRISGSRMGMEFVFSPGNEVDNNQITKNTSGLVVIYSDELHIHHNRIWQLRNFTGSALAIKESSHVEADHNKIAHCAIGLTINSPVHPENTIDLHHNLFTYNDIAMYFYGEKGGHKIHDNRYIENHSDILVSASSSAIDNQWHGNYWDNYNGHDNDGDGFGDQPYEIYLYADRLWMDYSMARFFRGSPVMELIDFGERLAPFSPPELVLRDPEPRVH